MNRKVFDPDTRLQHWQPIAQLETAIPEDFRYWIDLPGSLTEALRERSDNFSVEVLTQEHIQLSQVIPAFEGFNANENYFSRKVYLKHAGIPWVAAHTLIPQTSLRNGLEQLTALADKPLGELLFSTPGVQKDHLQACHTNVGWGRRARYLLKQQPLLVSEFFLPELISHERKRHTSLY